MRIIKVLILLCIFFSSTLQAQEIDCTITFTNLETLPAEARDNLVDFISQIEQYVDSYKWTNEDLGEEKIKCAINISFAGAPKENRYSAQAFIGSQRPIYKSGRNTAVIRILDDKWDFEYTRYQSLTHDEYRFDALLSFLDYYMYMIIGYDFDSYKSGTGTPYFQKALEIVNKSRGTGKGWEISQQSTYSRGQLVDELLNPKFRDLRDAIYRYHYRGLDLLQSDSEKARKNIFSALVKVGKLQEKINQRSLAIKVFFDTKYLEIAETFQKHSDLTIYMQLTEIDPAHKKTYDEYSKKLK